ncbi:MAG: hypothetical protein ACPG4M_02370 [Alphaproteobacteria bacterium]
MTELDLGWGFFAFLVIGCFGVFLQRGAPYFLPRAIIEWPVLKTLNRLLPAALILLFFLVTWVTTYQAGTLKPWVVIAEIVILLLAILMQLIFRRVLLTIVFAVLLHYLVFYHGVGWFLSTFYSWSP